jgi:hypothetical protein
MSLWSKIRGTIETIFQIGLGGPQVKNNAGNVDVRNSTDTGYVIVRGATPVAANDLATKAYVDSGSTILDGGIQTIQFAIGTGSTANSATSIPSGALIMSEYVVITTPYSAGTTITVGIAATPALLMGTGDSNPQGVGSYEGLPLTAWPSAGTVLATIAGGPVAGAGSIVVTYTQTPQP